MAERRMVRKDLCDDNAFNSLTMPAQLLYIMLIVHADDEGCFRADAKYWSRKVFYDKRQGPTRVERMLDELRNADLIITGESQNGFAGFLLHWFKMQTLTKAKSKVSEFSDFLVSRGIAPRWSPVFQESGSISEAMSVQGSENQVDPDHYRKLIRSGMPKDSPLFQKGSRTDETPNS